VSEVDPGARAARTMALLWRRAPGRAREPAGRSGLTVDRIVAAALGIADRDGLDALTMRGIADELGVSSMTPYGYVPSKGELLALMLDTVYERMTSTLDHEAGWRERVAAVAHDNRALHRARPWTLYVSTVRPWPGPGLLAKYERELSALEGIGLHDLEMDAALSHLLGLVRASVQAEVEVVGVTAETGAGDARWWESVGPVLAAVVDEAAYPLASRVGTAAGVAHGAAYSPDAVYAFGLGRLLDGIEALIASRTAGQPDRRD
jgi:AcrR family transcriptional regulator